MLAWAHRHQRLPAVPESSCSYADPSGSWPNLASPTPRMGGYVRDRACHVALCLCMCVADHLSGDTLPEWSKGVDSSSTSASCVGSNPTGVTGAYRGCYLRGRMQLRFARLFWSGSPPQGPPKLAAIVLSASACARALPGCFGRAGRRDRYPPGPSARAPAGATQRPQLAGDRLRLSPLSSSWITA